MFDQLAESEQLLNLPPRPNRVEVEPIAGLTIQPRERPSAPTRSGTPGRATAPRFHSPERGRPMRGCDGCQHAARVSTPGRQFGEVTGDSPESGSQRGRSPAARPHRPLPTSPNQSRLPSPTVCAQRERLSDRQPRFPARLTSWIVRLATTTQLAPGTQSSHSLTSLRPSASSGQASPSLPGSGCPSGLAGAPWSRARAAWRAERANP